MVPMPGGTIPAPNITSSSSADSRTGMVQLGGFTMNAGGRDWVMPAAIAAVVIVYMLTRR